VKDKKSVVVDALSRRPTAFSMTKISTDWKSILLVEYSKNTFSCELMEDLIQDDRYRVVDEIIYYEDRIYCNVPNFGHHYIIECYAYQISQMGVTTSSGDVEGFYWARLASFIIFHHQDPFRTAWLWFRCFPTISIILSYFGL
jgi:hypothetical protein